MLGYALVLRNATVLEGDWKGLSRVSGCFALARSDPSLEQIGRSVVPSATRQLQRRLVVNVAKRGIRTRTHELVDDVVVTPRRRIVPST